MKLSSYMIVLAILAEMARYVNENISKVDLQPLQQFLSANSTEPNS